MAIKKATMKQKVLDFIKAAGPKGRRFSEIQRFIVEDLHSFNYDLMKNTRVYDWKKKVFVYRTLRVYRSYWCTTLLRSGDGMLPYREAGLLKTYCEKVNGRWVHKDCLIY